MDSSEKTATMQLIIAHGVVRGEIETKGYALGFESKSPQGKIEKLYPVFQFETLDPYKTYPNVHSVSLLMDVDKNLLETIYWWLRPNMYLGGQTPASLLGKGLNARINAAAKQPYYGLDPDLI